MSIETVIADQNYKEALLKPKLEKSLDNLLMKYEAIMTNHHVDTLNELIDLIGRATFEGKDILIQKEYSGYLVMIWKGGNYGH